MLLTITLTVFILSSVDFIAVATSIFEHHSHKGLHVGKNDSEVSAVVLTGHCLQSLESYGVAFEGWRGRYCTFSSIIKYIMAQILFAPSLCQHQLRALVDSALHSEQRSLSSLKLGVLVPITKLFPWQPILLSLTKYAQIQYILVCSCSSKNVCTEDWNILRSISEKICTVGRSVNAMSFKQYLIG